MSRLFFFQQCASSATRDRRNAAARDAAADGKEKPANAGGGADAVAGEAQTPANSPLLPQD